MKGFAASLALLTAALVVRAAEWDHYQVILDRHPFGALTAVNTNVMPDFAKSLRLSAIWMAHGQSRAGIEDNTDKIKRDYVLSRGELSEDGLELLDVNVAEESAVIRKGTETATLHVQAGASTNMPVVNVPGMPPQPGGSSSGNPWRDFYERYRQRHQEGGGAPPPPQGLPMMQSGGTFQMGSGASGTISVMGGAQGQPIIIQMPSTMDQGRNSRNTEKIKDTGNARTEAGSSKRHSHNR
jgi:hypothetical protein